MVARRWRTQRGRLPAYEPPASNTTIQLLLRNNGVIMHVDRPSSFEQVCSEARRLKFFKKGNVGGHMYNLPPLMTQQRVVLCFDQNSNCRVLFSSNFHWIRSKILTMREFELIVPDLYNPYLGGGGGHRYSCFGLLLTSPLGFKARVGSALLALGRGQQVCSEARRLTVFRKKNVGGHICLICRH